MLALFSVNTYALSSMVSYGAKKIAWFRLRVNVFVILGPVKTGLEPPAWLGWFSPYHISCGDLHPGFEKVAVGLNTSHA